MREEIQKIEKAIIYYTMELKVEVPSCEEVIKTTNSFKNRKPSDEDEIRPDQKKIEEPLYAIAYTI